MLERSRARRDMAFTHNHKLGHVNKYAVIDYNVNELSLSLILSRTPCALSKNEKLDLYFCIFATVIACYSHTLTLFEYYLKIPGYFFLQIL